MGLWNRLKRLFGFGTEAETTEEEPDAPSEGAEPETAPEPGVCAICGTDVDPGTEACPLCGSTDIDAGEPDPDTPDDSPAPKTTRSASDDDAVAKLKQLRQQDEE